MGNLRRSLSSAAVSGEKSGLDLDDDTMEELSMTNSMIKAMFESSAPKYRYGGAAGSAENLACNSGTTSRPKSVIGGPVMRPSVRAREERKWVVDTVNKYFDVIVEDEEGDSERSIDEASFHETDEEEEESPYNSDMDEEDEISTNLSTTNQSAGGFKSTAKMRRMLSRVLETSSRGARSQVMANLKQELGSQISLKGMSRENLAGL